MKPRLFVFCFAWLLLLGCGPFDADTGAADPASWWPWVCDDGGLAPEGGCPAPAADDCDDAGSAADGACLSATVQCGDASPDPDGSCMATATAGDAGASDSTSDATTEAGVQPTLLSGSIFGFSTVPPMGPADVNPYGVAVVPAGVP